MSATIIAFPDARPVAGLTASRPHPPISAIALATKFTDHFLPVVQASMDLLEADEADFEARCRRMLDTDGTALVDKLCEELQIVGRQMKLLAVGLDLTRTRLRTAMARLVVSDAALP